MYQGCNTKESKNNDSTLPRNEENIIPKSPGVTQNSEKNVAGDISTLQINKRNQMNKTFITHRIKG